VPKERVNPDELYTLDRNGTTLYTPPHKHNTNNLLKPPKLSDSAVLFVRIMQLRSNTHCVLHSHAINTNLVTQLVSRTANPNEFRVRSQEMIKGMAGFGFFDELVVPIIENTAFEYELTDSMSDAINRYPNTHAILVRNHGLYVWGETWEVAKRHAECLHYLFDLTVEMHKCGLNAFAPVEASHAVDVSNGSHNGSRKRNANDANLANTHAASQTGKGNGSASTHKYKHYIFDIEGTTTPITFVKDMLFPYARSNLRQYLASTWQSQQTQEDIKAIYAWASEPSSGSTAPVPAADAHASLQIEFLVRYLEKQIDADSKHGALKQLQGHMWKLGYESGALKSIVYDDALAAFRSISAAGKHVSIYSSGSRQAQHSLFRYTQVGDIRGCIHNYFDTAVGPKRDPKSYENILLTLGYDTSDVVAAASVTNEVLFVTDILEEAQAAVQAGMSSVLSVRPGNAALAPGHGFKTTTNFELLE
jgi:methylthioribulose 1-phosphate dehydratase/enolase-phosphatase E1